MFSIIITVVLLIGAVAMAVVISKHNKYVDAHNAKVKEKGYGHAERRVPMADYAETTLDAVGCITVTEAARQLKQQDASIGQRRLFGLLRADGLVCQHSNQATAAAIERGYLRNVQRTYLDSEGVRRLRDPYAVVTPKGLAWMVRRYCRQTALA